MPKKIHLIAGLLATLTIATFFLSTLGVELFETHETASSLDGVKRNRGTKFRLYSIPLCYIQATCCFAPITVTLDCGAIGQFLLGVLA